MPLLLIRLFVGLTFVAYGVTKLLGGQFVYDDFVIDSRTVDPTYLVWSFYGYSPVYAKFVGLMELGPALLLLFPRTRTLGALGLFAVSLNITVLDFAFGYPAVKWFSLILTSLCAVLVAADRRRLRLVFWDDPSPDTVATLERAVAEGPGRQPLSSGRRAVVAGLAGVGLVLVANLLAVALYPGPDAAAVAFVARSGVEPTDVEVIRWRRTAGQLFGLEAFVDLRVSRPSGPDSLRVWTERPIGLLGWRVATRSGGDTATSRPAVPAAGPADRNVILVTIDGLRWQEVFAGADAGLIEAIPDSAIRAETRRSYWRDDVEARREALLPFVWHTIAREGQLFGNRHQGGAVRVTNGMRFSYPGYQEILAGFPDSGIASNDPVPNPNVTVLEWLNHQPGMEGRVAAFGSWDVFAAILNAPRAGFPVNAGWQRVDVASPTGSLLNRLHDFSTRTWSAERDDALTYLAAHDYLTARLPRLLYLALGDTDEWAHAGQYHTYLDMARRTDAMLRELWETVQSLPQYRQRTSLVLATDHGRGDGARWTTHGRDVPEAEYIWIGMMGPDTPARGVRNDVADATQSQLAATVAALLGFDYAGAVPRAEQSLGGVIRR